MFKPYAHRITPAAVVPVHTPEEAIEEATYAVRELGLKVIMIANHVRRPVPALRAGGRRRSTQVRTYVDSLAYESAVRLRPVLAALRRSQGRGDRALRQHGLATGASRSTASRYNHIGHFANASHAFAKALILGGVAHRFPQLRFAMLEGGVGWACNLVTDLVGHWEQPQPGGDGEPDASDQPRQAQLLKDLFARYGGRAYEDKMDEHHGVR